MLAFSGPALRIHSRLKNNYYMKMKDGRGFWFFLVVVGFFWFGFFWGGVFPPERASSFAGCRSPTLSSTLLFGKVHNDTYIHTKPDSLRRWRDAVPSKGRGKASTPSQ